MKRHLALSTGPACKRGKVVTDSPRQVTCLLCQNTEAFVKAKMDEDNAREAEFLAQVPRIFREPWHQAVVYMVCKSCGHNLFREGDRTCMGHYANFHCGRCGHVESRLTETGMAF